MSDDHEDDVSPSIHMMNLFYTPQQREQMRMQGISNGHETLDFLESLTVDQLSHISGILKTVVLSDGVAGNYFIGLIGGILQYNHKLCVVCGIDHDAALAEMAAPKPDATPPTDQEDLNRYPCCRGVIGYQHEHTVTKTCPKLLEYNVEPNDNGDAKVQCNNCLQWYTSLEDRMLQRSDKAGCPGCVMKERWG